MRAGEIRLVPKNSAGIRLTVAEKDSNHEGREVSRRFTRRVLLCGVSVRGRVSYFLHENGHTNRSGLHYLHQRVGYVDVGGEDGAAAGSGGVDGIGCGSIDFLDVMTGTGDGDAGRIGLEFDVLVVGNSGHPGMNLDLAGHARIEGEVQLAGHDLHDGDVARMAHLLRSQIKGSVAGLDVCQLDFRVNLVRLQLPDDAFRAADTDLRLGNRLRTDFELRWDVLKNDGGANGHFRRLLVG